MKIRKNFSNDDNKELRWYTLTNSKIREGNYGCKINSKKYEQS